MRCARLRACFIDFEEMMSFPHWIAIIAVAALPLSAFAQQRQVPDPDDPDAPVPSAGYVSIFSGYRSIADEPVAPDAAWRAANEAVAGSGDHGGHAMQESGNAAPPAANARPEAAGQAGHAGHHSKGK